LSTAKTAFTSWGVDVPIDRIVREYRNGEQPDAIHGAIAFYFGHKDEVEKFIAERECVQVQQDTPSAAPKGEAGARSTTAGAMKLTGDPLPGGCRPRLRDR
jgi:hypothetical protein